MSDVLPIRVGAISITVVGALLSTAPSVAAAGRTLNELAGMSIEDLASLEVTSVSKRAEPLSEAPASVYVITQDDIEAGAISSLPEALRLAPPLDVAQTSPSAYNVVTRGLSGNVAAQNFPNKLLVLVDGGASIRPCIPGSTGTCRICLWMMWSASR